eukprot:TRINITY_DN1413_c5_g1_i1.p1 TRINITY_DN1413_c5_g1~~TRINITY_DN1413_c5_g1_i1.p1  ORF type:complete len:639 (+),score=131.99 TRINITY_DN1413_c5_g1_i1:75-1919(+)
MSATGAGGVQPSQMDLAYLSKYEIPEIMDDMMCGLMSEKPTDPLEFCIKFMTEEKAKRKWRLEPHATLSRTKKPVLVCILDGWGESTVKDEYNAVHSAKTPTYDKLMSVEGRARTVLAHGTAVGLPSKDDMGNSEVGHNALGSGQVVDQGAKLVDNSISSGALYESDGWKSITPSFESNTLHLISLLTKGGVHARFDQLISVLKGSVEKGAKKIRLHLLTDGRDVTDGTSTEYCEELMKELSTLNEGGADIQVASGGGRMYVTMDRYEADWSIVERGWAAHVLGEAPYYYKSFSEALKSLRAMEGKHSSDQFLHPFVIKGDDDKPVGTIEDGDAVAILNFRADRMIELSKAFEYSNEQFTGFDRKRVPKVNFVGMMQYDGDLKLPTKYLVDAPSISCVSGEYLCMNDVSTFVCSETQKFGHVTFFWNGNRSGYINSDLETYFEEPSDNCVFDEKPAMKAKEVTAAAIEAIKSGKYELIRLNYANPDMVGHTGNCPATVTACEVVDECLAEILAVVEEAGGRWLVTSDHGNADDMVQREKKTLAPQRDPATNELIACKSHTLAPVPVCIGGNIPDSLKFRPDTDFSSAPGLANITATYMNLLGFAAPSQYEQSLI